MRLTKSLICSSPYLGVNSICTDDFCLVPHNILPKEEKIISGFVNTKIIKMEINQSPLIGVYLKCVNNKIVVGEDSIHPKELEILEKEGIKVKLIKDYNALGNLLAINSKYGIASPLLSKESVKEISKFFKVPVEAKTCVGLDLPGSSLYVNDKFFLVNPNIKKDEFAELTKKFGVIGKATTLNYGDSFVGNDLISNKHSIIVGSLTSNIELMKVDEIALEFEGKFTL